MVFWSVKQNLREQYSVQNIRQHFFCVDDAHCGGLTARLTCITIRIKKELKYQKKLIWGYALEFSDLGSEKTFCRY